MGASEQQRFVDAARNARTDGGVDTAANMLSGLAMFDILPALAALDYFSRDRVLGRARSALAPGANERIQFAGAVVTTLKITKPPAALPNDQVEDARSLSGGSPETRQFAGGLLNPNAANFSPEDIMIGRGNDNGRPPLVLYLGTPKRQIKKLTPPALLTGTDAQQYGLLGKPEVVR